MSDHTMFVGDLYNHHTALHARLQKQTYTFQQPLHARNHTQDSAKSRRTQRTHLQRRYLAARRNHQMSLFSARSPRAFAGASKETIYTTVVNYPNGRFTHSPSTLRSGYIAFGHESLFVQASD